MANLFILAIITSTLALAVFSALVENAVPTITPRYKELLLKVGATQDLNCSVTTSGNTNLKWTYPGNGKPINIKEWKQVSQTEDTTTAHSTLRIFDFDVANSGLYKCSLVVNDTSVDSEISLTAVGENKTEPKFVAEETSTTLFCSIGFENNISVSTITWLKVTNKSNERTEQLVSKLKNKDNFKEENNSLIITSPKIDDTGLYIARFTLSSGVPNTYDCEVGFEAGPHVKEFDKAKNLIEGEDMKLMCTVKGYPLPVVTWYKDNVVLNVSKDSRHEVQVTFDEHQIIKLLVSNVEFDDAGDYTCEAYSALFNETDKKTLTVRVKDKLAALWPFLGIVGEVIVLCTIIFIYEKRRNKQVQQEEKAAEEIDGSATDKKEGLRHRNTNPSA